MREDEIRARLSGLPGWEQVDNQIRKAYRLDSFKAAMAFANQVADLAEAADHHPDILIQYATVILTLSSHDTGGLTERDFRLAARIDER